MASMLAMMAKRRYDAIVAKQQRLERKKQRFQSKPPESTEDTMVWYWEQDNTTYTVMFNICNKEVWCNGKVLLTKRKPSSGSINTCICFTITCDDDCTCRHRFRENLPPNFTFSDPDCDDGCGTCEIKPSINHIIDDTYSRDITGLNYRDINQSNTCDTDQSALDQRNICDTESKYSLVPENDADMIHSADCICVTHLDKNAVIQEIALDGYMAYELFIDGCMIQEHSKSPLNYKNEKPETRKKND